jgi:hypothetical protein
MTVDDGSGLITICTRGRSSLFADDQGVTLRSYPRGARRFAWSEISRFQDGEWSGHGGIVVWALDIVLRTGHTVPVAFTRGSSARPEILAGVGQVAERYGIPADLTGVLTKDRLPYRGFYEDPGGQEGLRYWDGTHWSPLLPRSAGKGWRVLKSTERWAELPVTQQPWAYAARQAGRAKVWIRVCVVPTAALLVAGLVTGLFSGSWSNAGVVSLLAVFPAMFLLPAWLNWRQWPSQEKRLKDALNRTN